MPWHVPRDTAACPVSRPYAVKKEGTDELVACHATEESANRQVAALYAKEGTMGSRSLVDAYDRPGPSPDVQYRSYAPQLEVRAGQGGRTVYGIAVPYDAPTRINDNLVEQFARGAFDHQLRDPGRVKFAREHVALGGDLIGTATMLRDDPVGLYVELRVANTPKGDETLELIKDGALDQLSIAFQERHNRRLGGGVVERVKANLREVAAVLEGAYGDLAIAAGVRSRQWSQSYSEPSLDPETEALNAAAEKVLNE